MEIIIFIVGLVFATIGGFLLWDDRKFRRTAQASTGEILGYQVNQSRSQNTRSSQATYSPVIQYTYAGQQHQFTAAVGSNMIRYAIGAKVPILVSPSKPSQARLNSPALTILASIFFLIGLVSVVAFFFVFDFRPLSVLIAFGVLCLVLYQTASVLRRNKIHSLADIKQKLQDARMQNTRNGSETHGTIITDPQSLTAVKSAGKIPVFLLSLFLIIGLGACAGGIYLAGKRSDFLASAIPTDGTVISFHRTSSSSNGHTSTSYYPVVRYTPIGQSTSITFEHDIGSSHPSFARGDKVKVLYAPDDPHHAIIDQGWLNWFGPMMLIGIGGIFSLLGGSTLWKRRSARRPDSNKTGPRLEI